MALARKPSAFLYSLEQQLAQEYNMVLHQEYLYWQLKSRIMWLNYGDTNTQYFSPENHSMTKPITGCHFKR